MGGVSLRAKGALFCTASPWALAASSSDLPLPRASANACAFCSPRSRTLRSVSVPRMRSFTWARGSTEASRREARRITW